jgi:peptide/nickel transport system permease protein
VIRAVDWSALRRSPGVVAGALIVAAVMLLAAAGIEWGDSRETILTALFLAHSPYEQDRTVQPPSAPDERYLLGTDSLGRDLLSRVLHGARISLFVAVTAQILSLLLGVAVGALAGYAGGRTDSVLMRATDLVLALPLPIVAMGVMAIFREPDLMKLFVVLGLLGWGGIARLIRGEILSLREREFAEAARALGAGGARVAFRHLLPHALAPALILATVGVAGNILTEAWLSFLGIGAQVPAPSWGLMIQQAQNVMLTHPGVGLYPGLAIVITVAGFMSLAEGLRRMLDPRHREVVRAY